MSRSTIDLFPLILLNSFEGQVFFCTNKDFDVFALILYSFTNCALVLLIKVTLFILIVLGKKSPTALVSLFRVITESFIIVLQSHEL